MYTSNKLQIRPCRTAGVRATHNRNRPNTDLVPFGTVVDDSVPDGVVEKHRASGHTGGRVCFT